MTVNNDNTVNIAGWDPSNLTVKDGSGRYDLEKKTFHLKWNYIRNEVEYQVEGTVTNQKALLIE